MTTRIAENVELEGEFSSMEDLDNTLADETGSNDALESQVAVPDKFKNKSVEDVAEAYVNLEKEYGRRNQEIGELRKLTDSLLQQELSRAPQKKEDDKISEDDFIDDPVEAVKRVVSADETVKELRKEVQQVRHESALTAFEKRHPDWRTIAASPKFNDWMRSSPYRQSLFAQANNYNLDAADELFNIYADVTSASSKEEETQNDTRKRDLKRASSERGSTGGSTRKVYRRADLIRLKLENPNKYESMQDEILAAYSEGRVK